MTRENVIAGLVFAALFAAGMSYLLWLDAGCDISGVMTWEGKVCFE